MCEKKGGASATTAAPVVAAARADGKVRVACPHCSRALKVQAVAIGRKVRCPGCARPFDATAAGSP